jgi:hypothetical protein
MRPYSCCALGLRVGEDHSGGLRKRASWVGQSGAVRLRSGLRHLRLAPPARPALPDSRCGAFGSSPQPGPSARTRRRYGLGKLGHAPRSGPAAVTRWSERRSSWTARAAVANLRGLKPRHVPEAYVTPNLRTGLPTPPEQFTMIAVSVRVGTRVGGGAIR